MIAPKLYPFPIQHLRYARNGYAPDVNFARSLAYAMNHGLAYRKKVFMSAAAPLAGTMGESGSTLTYWRSRMKTGLKASKLKFDLLLGLNRVDEVGIGHNAAAVNVKVTPSGGSTTTNTIYFGSADGNDEDDPLNTLAEFQTEFSVSASTTYEIAVEGVDGGRPIAVSGIEYASPEITDGMTGDDDYLPHGLSAHRPIDDGLRQAFTKTMSKMWLEGGAPLFHFPGNGAGTAQSVTGTTWTNIFDATTTVATSSCGFFVGAEGAGDGSLTSLLPMCRLKDGDDLPVTFAVYGNASANGGEVKFVDSGGSGLSALTLSTTLGWVTSDTTLTNVESFASNKLDIMARHNTGGQTVNVWAVSIYARGA